MTLLLLELLFLAVLVMTSAIALWRGWSRTDARRVPPGSDTDEPRVLAVDLSDREPPA